jgi:hypothetical protein
MTGLKIQPGSVRMFEHLNFVVVLIKPWNLGGVQVNGGWCPQVRLGTRCNSIQTWKGVASLHFPYGIGGYVYNILQTSTYIYYGTVS